MTNKIKFKNNLRILREKKKYSLGQLSQKLDIPKTTLSRYEVGERKISSINLMKLSSFFKVSPEYLLGFEDDKKKDNIITKEQLTKDNMAFFEAKDISDEDKKEMIELLQEFYYKQKYEK
ncbi:helix-turn-helix domain-containing protein [Leptotrichia sp. oral taxon 847]|uniref:helix-turn-helix domain-containing protein n=1 Tax=Leptotrichia sp. oral taxon 847 TaxID=1785996 RepID=UPI0007683048|nr:helix-turn-helix transcriptional regulator [Leptotrichia sp. oral taxon 847]AMD95900.1 hypothetical protein AXF11_10150 [Leptotrichia sp. oral taxon 847]